jgi:hypothetical protein
MGRIQMVNMKDIADNIVANTDHDINTPENMKALREKWIKKLEQHQTTWYTKNDEELLLLLKQPVNPFTKDELDVIYNTYDAFKVDEEESFETEIADKAKKLRDSLR